MVVALLIALLGTWFVLGVVCGFRLLLKMMSGMNTTQLLLMLVVTHMVGLGLIMVGGFAWAAWLMVTSPFRLVKHLRVPAPPTGTPEAVTVAHVAPRPLPAYSYNSTRYIRHYN